MILQKIKLKIWRKVKLGEVLDLKYGFGLPEKKRVSGNISVYGSSGIVGMNNKEGVGSSGIIVGRKGNVGSIYYSDKPFYPIDTVYYIDSLKIPGDIKFFYYFLQRIPFKKIGSDVGVPGLNRDIAYSLDITIPIEKEYQKRIASILSAFDDNIELNNKISKNLEQSAQAIFKEWFINNEKLKVKSEKFKIEKIGSIAEVVLGGTPSRLKKEYWGGNIPWINSGKANEFRIISASENITAEGLKKSNTQLMPKRTTVIAITGATLGQVSLLEIEACANQSVVGIFGSELLSPEFIYLFIKDKISEIIQEAAGGAQQHINKGIIENYSIIVPSKETILKFDKIIKPVFDEISKNFFENQKLAALRDLFLPKLMSGDIRV